MVSFRVCNIKSSAYGFIGLKANSFCLEGLAAILYDITIISFIIRIMLMNFSGPELFKHPVNKIIDIMMRYLFITVPIW
jgi:uncharacterized membrane protein YtjA (UPF0391 family)